MEFHAVILCGEGEKLAPFTAASATGTPKGLLPVNNQPLVSYVLDWCKAGNFNQVTLVCSPHEEEEYKTFIGDYLNTNQGLNTNLATSDADTTGGVVAEMRQNINSDFVILPCDFITDLSAQELIDSFRRLQDENVLISGVYYKNNLENIEKKALVADYILHTPLTYKPLPVLLDSYSKDGVSLKKAMDVRMGLLWRYANAVVSTKILRASIFFCSLKLLKILDSEVSNWENKDWNKVVRDVARRSWCHQEAKEYVAMELLPDSTSFVRANNLSAYVEANRHILKLNAKDKALAKPKVAKGTAAAPAAAAAQVGTDSCVGRDGVLGEKTSVKRSVIGNNYTIGKKCRITGCVIMDNVTLGDEVVLENCLIGKGAVIHNKSKLTSCNVEGQYEVEKSSNLKNETLKKLSINDTQFSLSEGESGSDKEEGEEDSSDDGSEEEGEWEISEGEGLDDEDDDGLFDRS